MKPYVTTIFVAIVQRLIFLMQNDIIRFSHIFWDTGIFWEIRASLLNWQFELPASGTRETGIPSQFVTLSPGPSRLQRMFRFSQIRLSLSTPTHTQVLWSKYRQCLTEKFVLEVVYRETRPPFWDALISRYRRPMTNGASGLFRWHWGNQAIASVPVKQPWRIVVKESIEFAMRYAMTKPRISTQYHHSERDDIGNYRYLNCLFNSLMRTTKNLSKAHITGNWYIPLTKGQQRGKRFHVMGSSLYQQNKSQKLCVYFMVYYAVWLWVLA